jgi:pimeloyl-ACP methyl ester carboxylesterase
MMRSAAIASLMLAALAVSACSTFDREGNAAALAGKRGWAKTVVDGGRYRLASFGPRQVRPEAGIVTVYIEGDGLAWLDASTPSLDPTPKNAVGLQLAVADGRDSVVYFARPCQYVEGRDWGICSKKDWTDARFSTAIVETYSGVLDRLKVQSGANGLELIGYSGGGAVAALLAERRSDVVRLVTVASPLDVAAWVRHHDISPLTGSLDPADRAASLATLPQVHITGTADKVVPSAVLRSFVRRLPASTPVRVQDVDATHECCWDRAWPSLRAQMGPAS